MSNLKKICVYSSSSDAVDKIYFEAAETLGNLIAVRGHTLVYGGANIGLMGKIATSVHTNKGKVIGIIPEVLLDKGITFENADELIVTKDLRERKAKMDILSDAFIALPGGFGTLEEILEILTLKQLNVHNKPVIFLNTNNFYSKLMEVFELIYENKFAKADYRDMYFIAGTPEEAISYIESYTPFIQVSKWFFHRPESDF